jgi:TrmH family RNA methyltransferase
MNKYSKENNLSYALGSTVCFELLKNNNVKTTKLFLHSKLIINEQINELILIANKRKIEIIKSDKIFNIISNKENNFVIAEFEKYNATLNTKNNHLVLVNPSNSGNLGTIIRTCLGFDIYDIAIIKPAVDDFDPQTIRATMGARFNVNIEYFNKFEEYYEKYNISRHFFPFMLQATSELSDIKEMENKYSLVFGNESSGLIPREYFLSIGTPLIIKHNNKIDSLNLSMSVGIAVF